VALAVALGSNIGGGALCERLALVRNSAYGRENVSSASNGAAFVARMRSRARAGRGVA
jgi:hypothetical protein